MVAAICQVFTYHVLGILSEWSWFIPEPHYKADNYFIDEETKI